ncbi:MAG TPA: DUF5677 domain-containing protein [Acidobacteriaceae bacterium]|jgi:hypothetical protein|nr:DUF5677 domain-containing protein [Acidobacteriaceae bacterium]
MAGTPRVEYIKAVSHLMDETRKFLDGLNVIPRQTSPADSILLALVSKSIILTEAIVVLVANGFADEAYGLCRTSVEIELTVRYLTNDDVIKRCNRYFLYFTKDKSEWIRLIQKYYPDLDLKRPADADELDKLAAAYPNPHRWSECPDGVKGFAAEPSTSVKRDDGSPSDQLFTYEVLYKWMSHYVHGTITSIDPAHITIPGDRFRIHPGAGLSNRGKAALRTSFLNVHMNMSRVLRYFNMDIPEFLGSEYENVVALIRDGSTKESKIS